MDAHFHGQTLHTTRIRDTFIAECVYSSSSQLPQHVHDTPFITLVLAGAFTEIHGAHRIEHAPGSISYHPGGEEHEVTFGSTPVRCLNIHLSDAWMQRVLEEGAPMQTFLQARNGILIDLAARIAEETTSGPASSILRLEGLLLEMLGAFVRLQCPSSEPAAPLWMEQVEQLLHLEFDRSLTVHELARRIGMHPVHLSRTWRRFRGCSIGHYVHRIRIESACRLLAEGGASLAVVAHEVGFADQTHFSSVFKQLMGITPGAYRRGVK